MTRLATAVALAVLVPSTVLASTPATAVGETCQGRPATIVGTGAKIVGTPGDDVIVTGSADTVEAGAGNDLICATVSNVDYVYIEAGDGDDTVDASTSTGQFLQASLGAGLDRFMGGPDAEHVYADGTDDSVATGGGDDSIFLFADTAVGTAGSYDGGPGDNFIRVLSLDVDVEIRLPGQVLVGGAPVASIQSIGSVAVVAPRAIVRGDDQDNHLEVRSCDGEVYGGAGDDFLNGGYIEEDLVRLECADKALVIGGSGDDDIRGSLGRDRLEGGAGADRLRGRTSANVLLGGAGPDVLDGGHDRDLLRGGAGNDSLSGAPGKDTLLGDGGRDSADGDDGRDRCVAEKERNCER